MATLRSKSNFKKNKPEWLGRALSLAPYFCLCLTEKDYHKKLDDIKISKKNRNNFVNDNAAATTRFYTNSKNETCCIVTLTEYKKYSTCEIFALLAHEAMHIWREKLTLINESKPSPEFEAYAIQSLCLGLFVSFSEQVGNKDLMKKQK
jgi:hypothetical protein